MIGFYDLLGGNKARTKVLPSVIAYRAHLSNQFYHVFTMLISMPRFESINFFPKLGQKLRYF